MLLLFALLNAMIFTLSTVNAWSSDGTGYPNPVLDPVACRNYK